MRSNKLLNRAIALALTTMSTLACAVSLGDLTVQSRPGEPMQATLQIEDLDLTISPLLVRVAPHRPICAWVCPGLSLCKICS